MLEEVEDNPFLARFYEDADKYALPVQLYFLLTRYNQQRTLSQQDLFTQATVSDYLFAKDRIFAAQNLAPDELALYDNVYRLLDERMVKPDLVVFMSARIDVLAERLRKRNRDFERDISLEYLERISAAYRDFFFYYDEAPLLVVETFRDRFCRGFERSARSNPRDRARRAGHAAFRPAQRINTRVSMDVEDELQIDSFNASHAASTCVTAF